MLPEINNQDIIILKNYKYESTPLTPFETFLTPFWFFIVNKLPLWIAPNLITFTGFVVAIIGFLVMLSYDTTMDSNIPSWALIFTSFCVFFYQTLDNIDGKQARRTKSSSILGQLFDHGCDSFLMPFLNIQIFQTIKVGSNVGAIWWMAAMNIIFYITTWEEYNIGVLPVGAGILGSSESYYLMIILFLSGGIFGCDTFKTPLIKSEWANAVYLNVHGFYILATALTLYNFAAQAIVHIRERKQSIWVRMPAFIPFILYVLAHLLISGTKFYKENGAIVIATLAPYFFLMNAKMFLCTHMKKKVSVVGFETVVSLIPAVHHWAGLFGIHLLEEYHVWALVGVLMYSYAALFIYHIISTLCKGLNIKCFAIPPVKAD